MPETEATGRTRTIEFKTLRLIFMYFVDLEFVANQNDERLGWESISTFHVIGGSPPSLQSALDSFPRTKYIYYDMTCFRT